MEEIRVKYQSTGKSKRKSKGKTEPQEAFSMGFERAATTIPEGNISAGPLKILLLKQNKHGAVIPIRSIDMDPDNDITSQVREWALLNDFELVELTKVKSHLWGAVFTLRKKGEPWANCFDLRYH